MKLFIEAGNSTMILSDVEIGNNPFIGTGTIRLVGKSKTKNLASVDTEKLASVDAFVEYALTENRLKQGLSKLEEMGLPKDISSLGAALSWVVRDTISEELDTLAASGLVPKDVTGKLSTKARAFYLENLV